MTESQAAYRYAEGKWTLKEVVGHITDAERVMTYRLLRFARGDQTPLTGFDQELFIPPFRKLDNRAISRRLPGRTAINDYIAVRATSGGVDPQGHSQQPKHYGARPRVRHCRTRASSHGGYPKPVLELIVGRGLWNGTKTTHTTLDTVLIRVPPHNHQLKDLDYF